MSEFCVDKVIHLIKEVMPKCIPFRALSVRNIKTLDDKAIDFTGSYYDRVADFRAHKSAFRVRCLFLKESIYPSKSKVHWVERMSDLHKFQFESEKLELTPVYIFYLRTGDVESWYWITLDNLLSLVETKSEWLTIYPHVLQTKYRRQMPGQVSLFVKR